ncbi:cytochrome P450, family 4, subfamily B, polypeptide 1 [Mytilus galloprovincialis]|uniref:Cytochrome P450, family 4, subfamily B, polypeptide 1 n=1 Tax=Mytilus galloprovincialis TaxID=29158 RepID=A0A8B6C7T0_MYTGA|nr:cytochrome P450, family 4, subfamily B, polypeptide 1 [Mytilus galloprovincialis]
MGTITWTFVVGAVTLVMTYIGIRLYRYLKWLRYVHKTLSKLPGPKPHWLFGNIFQIGNFSEFHYKCHEEFIVQKKVKIYVFWLSTFFPTVMLAHPDTIKEVMRSNSPKPTVGPGYPFLVPWLGQSLLLSNGAKWERNRRLLTPAFHFSILTGYFKIYNEVTDVLMDKLATMCEKRKYIDIFKPASMATLDTLLQCALGYRGDVQQVGEHHPYVIAVNRLGFHIQERCLYIHHYPEFIYRYLTANGREFFKLCDYVHKFSKDIISTRRKELNENKETEKKKHLDFLDILITAKDDNGVGLTDDEIRAEVDTFLFAGHDTTSCVLSWSMYCLGKFKAIQDKVYQEIKQVIGSKNTVDSEDLSNLRYLTCFLKEVMRLHSPVSIVNRMLDQPVVTNGVEIPAGILIDLGIYHAQNHPDVWQNPTEFRPERFEGDKHHEMDPYSFTPFSAGPRNCIGMNFAQNEEKVMIARIIKRFEVSLDPDHVVEPFMEVVLRAKTGIMVNFKERDL